MRNNKENGPCTITDVVLSFSNPAFIHAFTGCSSLLFLQKVILNQSSAVAVSNRIQATLQEWQQPQGNHSQHRQLKIPSRPAEPLCHSNHARRRLRRRSQGQGAAAAETGTRVRLRRAAFALIFAITATATATVVVVVKVTQVAGNGQGWHGL